MKKVVCWDFIAGIEGYLITTCGVIYSIHKKVPKPRVCSVTNSGYKMAVLSKDKKKVGIYPHREVAKKFIPNPDRDKKTQVNHIDGNKWNNSVSNLEWCTPSENGKHAVKIGLQQRGTRDSQSKLTWVDVLIARDLSKRKLLSQKKIGKLLGVSEMTINHTCRYLKYKDVP